jgi:hypothetical protein
LTCLESGAGRVNSRAPAFSVAKACPSKYVAGDVAS